MLESINYLEKRKYNLLYVVLSLFLILIYLDTPFRIIGELLFYSAFGAYFIYKNRSITTYSLWSVLMIMYSGLSIFWTADTTQTLIDLRILTQMSIISILIIGFVDNEDKLDIVFKSFVVAGIGLVSFLFTVIPFSAFLEPTTRIGVGMGIGMQNVTQNSNDIGLNLTVSSILTFYLYRKERKWFYLVILAVFLFIIFLTGSRKSILFSTIGIVAMIILQSNSPGKLIKNIIVSIGMVILAMYLLFNIPALYEVAGKRLESLFELLFSASGGGDGSTNARTSMISKGLQLLGKKPLFGYGIGSYSVVSGVGTYSHNNYIELGVGIGIIGTLIYYSIYVTNLFNLIKNYKIDYLVPLLILSSLLPVIEFGFVSYKSFTWNIIVALSFATIRYTKKNAIANF